MPFYILTNITTNVGISNESKIKTMHQQLFLSNAARMPYEITQKTLAASRINAYF